MEGIQQSLFEDGKIAQPVGMKKQLWESVIESGRWQKWLLPVENSNDFYANSQARQEWLIKTGCRYIWEEAEVVSTRARLYQNLELQGIDAGAVVESSIEGAMDRYFFKFNLVGLNKLL